MCEKDGVLSASKFVNFWLLFINFALYKREILFKLPNLELIAGSSIPDKFISKLEEASDDYFRLKMQIFVK